MTATGIKRILDLQKRSEVSSALHTTFSKRVVGQPEAVEVLVDIVEKYQAGLAVPTRPAGNALFLGPTGSGKTYTVESMVEALTGSPQKMIKINCSEFQMDHEIAKLVGSPPGYLGHRETHPALTQEAINECQTEAFKLTVILFDEIEKASDTLWRLLLGILDKAELTLGDNRKVNFSQTIILLTSNLGVGEMNALYKGGIGIKPNEVKVDGARLKDIAIGAAKRKFSPEFMNRMDHLVVFNTLTEDDIMHILAMEIASIRLTYIKAGHVEFRLEPGTRGVLFREGYSKEYGARNVKRTLEKRISIPLSRLISSNQVTAGDTVVVSEVGAPEFEFALEG